MPRFETVKVAPESSGGVIWPSLTLAARLLASAAISQALRPVVPMTSSDKPVSGALGCYVLTI